MGTRSPRIRSVWLVAVLLAAASHLGPAAARADVPLTALEAGPLGRADVVIVGEVGEVRDRGPVRLARVRVERVLKGPPPGDVVTVLVGGPRATRDPQAPTAPYFEGETAGRHALFLAAGTDRATWRLEALFAAEGALGREKLRCLEAHVELVAIADPEVRARRTLAYLLDASGREGTWTRVHAARELNHLAGVRPDLFSPAVRRTVERLLGRSAIPAQRAWLGSLLRRLDPGTDPVPAPAAPPAGEVERALREAPDPEARREALERLLTRGGTAALGRLLGAWDDLEASERVALLDALGEGGYRPLLPEVLARYAREDEADVLVAIVRCAGMLGDADTVPWLAERFANPRVHRHALFALARIRTPAALAVLRREGERARREGPKAGDTAALADYLLSEAFVQAERSAGREVGARRVGQGG